MNWRLFCNLRKYISVDSYIFASVRILLKRKQSVCYINITEAMNSPPQTFKSHSHPRLINQHLMTSPKGNSEFCFHGTLHVQHYRGRRETKLLLLEPVIKCFCVPLMRLKNREKIRKTQHLLGASWHNKYAAVQRCST